MIRTIEEGYYAMGTYRVRKSSGNRDAKEGKIGL